MTTLSVDKGWNYTTVDVFNGGVHTEADPTLLAPAQLVRAKGVLQDKRGLTQDYAFNTELAPGTNVSISGIPRQQVQYDRLNGTTVTALITNDYFYILNTSDFWQPVYNNDATTTLSSGASATDTSLSVVDDANFDDGDYLAIELDNGEYHITTVNGTPTGNTINIDDAMPAAAASSNEVYTITKLTGTVGDSVDWVVMFSQDWLVFTNGVDNVKRYDGSTLEDVPNLPSSGNTQARHVAVVDNHLVLMRTTEGGSVKPHRVRWSDRGDPTNWSTGDSSFTDLIDTEDQIVATENLGPYQIIYKDDTIIRMEAINSTAMTFDFKNMVHGSGAISANAVAVLKDSHVVFGQHSIYRYTGGFGVEPIDDEIFERYLAAGAALGRANADRIFAHYMESIDEIWFAFPFGNDTTAKNILKYVRDQKVWLERDCNFDIYFISEYTAFNTTTYDDLSGVTYDDLAGQSYSSFSSSAGKTVVVLGSSSAVIQREPSGSTSENGETITYLVETKDFNSPRFKMRFDALDVMSRTSQDMTVSYSTDQGATWTVLGTINNSNQFATNTLHKQFISRYLRFKFEGTGDNALFLKGIGMLTKLESES